MTIKALVRDLVASTLSVLKYYDVSLGRKNSWLVLTFHRVLPQSLRDDYPLANLAVTPEELAWIIDSLSPYYTVKTVSDAAQLVQSGESFGPLLSISFDDGQWDNFEYARPVLKAKNTPATFYLPTDFIGTEQLLWHDQAAFAWGNLNQVPALAKALDLTLDEAERQLLDCTTAPAFVRSLKLVCANKRQEILVLLNSQQQASKAWARMMSWQEARLLLEDGHEVGSHGKSHHLLPQQGEVAQRDELLGSRMDIEKNLGVSPQSFCFPNGDFDERTIKILQQSDYTSAVSTHWGRNNYATSPYKLLRCDMNPFLMTDRYGNLSRNRLLMRLAGLQRGNGR